MSGLRESDVDAARAGNGGIEAVRRPCALGVVVSEALGALPLEARKGIAVEGDAIAFCDAELIRQALVVVLANVSGEAGEGASVRTRVEDDRAIVTISANHALGADEIDRLLLPFEPLGLARWLVEAQDGGIEVATRAGGGTTLTLTLPLAFGANSLRAPSVRPGRLVLAIDDDAAKLDLYERALSPQGFRVVGTSRSRVEAAMAESRPDVMLVAGMSFDPGAHPSIPVVSLARPSLPPASRAELDQRCQAVVDKDVQHPSFNAELGAALHAAIPTRVPTTRR